MKLTLTYYTLEKAGKRLRGSESDLSRVLATSSLWEGAELVVHTHTYFVGQPVQVHSYGAWRDGLVTAIRRTTVEVRYARNKKGLQHVKRFTAESLRPGTRGAR